MPTNSNTFADKRPAQTVVLVCMASLALLFIALTVQTWYGPDIWYHMALGRKIIATFEAEPAMPVLMPLPRYTNVYWLYQIIAFTVYSVGGTLAWTIVNVTVIWAAIVYSWQKVAQLRSWGPLRWVIVLLVILIFRTRFDPRPENFSFLFLMLQILILSQLDPRTGYTLKQVLSYAAIEVLWANMHGYFVFGVLLVGARAFSYLVYDHRFIGQSEVARRRIWKTILVMFTVTLVASICSPLGFRTWHHVWVAWQVLQGVGSGIQEFSPPLGITLQRFWTLWIFWVYLIGVVAASILLLWKRKGTELFAVILALAGVWLGATALRNTPLTVLMSALIWPEVHRVFFHDIKLEQQGRTLNNLFVGCTAGFSVLFAIWTMSGGFYRSLHTASDFGYKVSNFTFPVHFAEFIAPRKFSGRVFNDAPAGSYLDFHVPTLRVFADSRFLEDPEEITKYFRAIGDVEGFDRLNAEFNFDGVLLKLAESEQVIRHLLNSSEWSLVYAELHRAFFVAHRRAAPGVSLVPTVRFYQGEDLSYIPNGQIAGLWLQILAQAGRWEDFRTALYQFSQAPQIPPPVFQGALDYARIRPSRDSESLVQDLQSKLIP